MSAFGLTPEQTQLLQTCIAKHLPRGSVIVYGSRARGNFTPRSDIDLVVKHSQTSDYSVLSRIKDEVDESNFPYICEIQYYENIKNRMMISNIERVGKIFYQKET